MPQDIFFAFIAYVLVVYSLLYYSCQNEAHPIYAGRTTQLPVGKPENKARGSSQVGNTREFLSSSLKCDSAPRQPSNTGAPSLQKKIPFLADGLEDAPVTSRQIVREVD